MGWFKSAEEKAAEKRKKELLEKYGEKDGLRIFEHKISEKKFLEERKIAAEERKKAEEEKKKKAEEEKKKKEKQRVLNYIDKYKHGKIEQCRALYEDNFSKADVSYGWKYLQFYKRVGKKKFIQLVKELIEEGKLFTYKTWKGEKLSRMDIEGIPYEQKHYFNVFTKSYGEKCIAEKKQALKEKKQAPKEKAKCKKLIIDLLTKKSIKMTISDITAHIKHDKRNYVKWILEEMHKDGNIDFAGNGRYFIYSEEKKKPKPKKASAPKSEEVDIEKELEKLKGLLDKGLITQEQYDAKSNELLGL